MPAAGIVTWNGSIPVDGSVTININALIGNSVSNATILSAQGTINFDADGNGTNELSTLTDDLAVAGNRNATTFAVLAPTAASVVVSGRVTNSNGRGVSQATVAITGSSGAIRNTRTNPFGYYRFDQVAIGETYIFSVQSKQYRFAPRVVSLVEELTNFDFTAEP